MMTKHFRLCAVLAGILASIAACDHPGPVADNSVVGAVQAAQSRVAGMESNAVAMKAQGSAAAAPVAIRQPLHPERQQALLATEARLMKDGSLWVPQITPLIKDDRSFRKLQEQLALEAARDPLAQDMTDAQRKAFMSRLDGKARLGNMACGLSLCVGVVDWGGNGKGLDDFTNAFLSDPSLSGYSLVDYKVDLGKNNVEQRFVLSVDPGAQGIVMPINPKRR